MRSDTEKYGQLVATKLEMGERVLLAVRAEYRAAQKTHAAVRLLERAVEGAPSGPPPAGSIAAAIPLKSRVLLVVTDQRLLVFKQGTFGPGALAATMPVDSLVHFTATKAKTAFGKLDVRFADGSGVILDLVADRNVAAVNELGLELTGS